MSLGQVVNVHIVKEIVEHFVSVLTQDLGKIVLLQDMGV
jgi:hypothetical protein